LRTYNNIGYNFGCERQTLYWHNVTLFKTRGAQVSILHLHGLLGIFLLKA